MVVIGILGHGGFPEGLRSAVELICGRQENMFAIGLNPEDSPESYAARVQTEMDRYGPEAQFLLFADLKGGTPCNIAARLLSDSVVCLVGASLPMLLHTVISRDSCSLRSLSDEALQVGHDGLMDLGAELRRLSS